MSSSLLALYLAPPSFSADLRRLEILLLLADELVMLLFHP